MTGVQQREVLDVDDGMRLDRWFRQHFPALGHGQLQKLVRTGQVRVDGSRVKTGTRLDAGQTVRVPPLPDDGTERVPRKRRSIDLTGMERGALRELVVYQDDDVLAINKPSGLAVQGGAKTDRHLDGMLDALKFGAPETPRLVHRLDKDTSGVLLLARSRAVAAILSKTLQRREAEKLYWALVIGTPRPSEGIIDAPLVKTGRDGKERVVVAGEDDKGRNARTIFETLDQAGGRMAWLAMQPVTGRTHQIRAHAAALGHPIVGDGKYGGADAHPGPPIARKLHLHARALRLPHPRRGTLEVDAPLPPHMIETWQFLAFEVGRPFAMLGGPER
ncbi:MAG: RluA family pseudouridine synthase [Hyphomicrobiaceae bacterium]